MSILISWGKDGGWYIYNGYTKRLCMGKLCFTYFPFDLDEKL